ncbi:uncharacterized protein LOC126368233 [Pectinophora gossypiella]|uniref:uncharacterized protein LOC126368233 n=1 Tax=Pectinophora gossypiella TaxID=13191 RepID=UPI00214E22E5|nr:uncharacterized protein LOC126368233 [Pectinophora gossypiella]
MSLHLIYFVLLLNPALLLCRHVPNFAELDEDEQHLFRAAYDSHSYDTHSYEAPSYEAPYEEEEDLHLGKLDLVKDGLWAVKAKLKELKAVNKALAANVLLTKLKLKDLLKNHLVTVKKHHHEKPSYSYQAPAYAPAPQYAPAPPQYAPAPPQYAPAPAAAPQYAPAAAQYGPEPPYVALQYGHDPYYGH